jgi:CDP-diacylglycerol--glycerol-3-phosphate 3-phosphatidyltransferase
MFINNWKKEILTIPNLLSLFRLVLVPVYVGLYLHARQPVQFYTAGAVITLSCLTDALDGWIARQFHMISTLGKILDPLADKLLTIAAMCMFCEWGAMPAWALMIVLTREFAVTGLRLVAVGNGTVIAAGWSGKVKTASTMVGLCVWMAFPTIGWLGWVVTGVIARLSDCLARDCDRPSKAAWLILAATAINADPYLTDACRQRSNDPILVYFEKAGTLRRKRCSCSRSEFKFQRVRPVSGIDLKSP